MVVKSTKELNVAMKRLLYFFALVLLCGCQEDIKEESFSPNTNNGPRFYGEIADVDSRTFVDENITLRWHAEDQLSLFVDSTVNKKYQFNGETGDNSGYFTDISTPSFGSGNSVNCHYAVYPYDSTIKLSDDGILTVNFPSEQTYAEKSFGRGANIMVAATENTSDYNLQFRNVGSYLRVSFWGKNQKVKSIVVESNGNEIISGSAKVTPVYAGEPTCEMTGSGKGITLNCEEAVEVSSSSGSPTDFWIVLPPTTFTKGFTVTIVDDNDNKQFVVIDKSFTFARNTYYTLTRELTISSQVLTPPNNEIWYTTTNGKAISLSGTTSASTIFGTSLVSNTYTNGKGVLKFSANVTRVGSKSSGNASPLATIVKIEGGFASNTTLKTVSLPNSVTKLGSYAFYDCSALEEVSMGQNVTQIGASAFKSCTKLFDVYLPDSVTTIEEEAFKDCTSLESVSTPTNIAELGYYIFSGCTSLKQFTGKYALDNGRVFVKDDVLVAYAPVSGSDYKVQDGITTISECAFYNCDNLKYVILPKSITSINHEAFNQCDYLSYVYCQATIPPDLGPQPFLTTAYDFTIYVPSESVELYQSKWSKYKDYIKGYDFDENKEIVPPAILEPNEIWYTTTDGNIATKFDASRFNVNVTSHTYENGKGIITFDGEVTKIGSSAFYKCTNLKSVSLPNGVSEIALIAFGNCTSLEDIRIPVNLKIFGDYAFLDCTSLTSVTVPDNLTSFGEGVFAGCTAIKEFKGFYAKDNGRALYMGSTIVAYANASGSTYSIIRGITDIASAAFSGCVDLTKITIPDSIINIGYNSFARCTGLTCVTIPAQVATINDFAFEDCDNLYFVFCKATTPPTISSYSFNNDVDDRVYYVPESAVNIYKADLNWSKYADEIEGYDFSNHNENDFDFINRTTPKNNEIFYTSTDLNAVTPNSLLAFDADIVSNRYFASQNKGVIIFEDDISYVGAEAFKNKKTLSSITLPASVKQVGNYAFAGTALTKFTLPTQAYSIGSYAFYGCSKLSDVDLANVIMIGDYAFKDCALTSVTIPASAESFGHGPFKCSTLKEFKGPNIKGDGRSLYIGYVLVQLADGVCKNITSYTVPNDVLTICEGVFQDYTSLATVSLPEGLQTIYANAFKGCSSLKKVIIPSTLTVLYNYAFKNCASLKSIYFNSTKSPTEIYNADESWDLCSRSTVIRVAKGSLTSYTYEGAWQEYNVVEFEPGDYSHDDEPSGGGDTGGDTGDNSGDGNMEGLNNGDVVTFQKATEGNGIDIILMGDAYSQASINSGKYHSDLKKAVEMLFVEEPYKSFRHLFNIYFVTAVSAQDGYSSGSSVFEGYFGTDTEVGGNHDTVLGYALQAIPVSRIEEALVIVLMNRKYYAGTCYMGTSSYTSDYGSGISVSYFPLGTDDEMLGELIRHEAGGHGFAKLADEYAYQYMGAIPASVKNEATTIRSQFGWYKNIDFTNNQSTVLWSQFLNDSRYYFDGLGLFEGGFTYWTGVWRPTDNSIMNQNTGGYNAPSREAIYHRIHKLAYGANWRYNYETFVSWDSKNRSTKLSRTIKSRVTTFTPIHPPVIIKMPLPRAK